MRFGYLDPSIPAPEGGFIPQHSLRHATVRRREARLKDFTLKPGRADCTCTQIVLPNSPLYPREDGAGRGAAEFRPSTNRNRPSFRTCVPGSGDLEGTTPIRAQTRKRHGNFAAPCSHQVGKLSSCSLMAAWGGGCVAILFAKGFGSVNELVKMPVACGIDGLLCSGTRQTHVHVTISEESLSYFLGTGAGLVVSWSLVLAGCSTGLILMS